MTPEGFLQRIGALLQDPLLLVSNGVVVTANNAARQILPPDGAARVGGPLDAWVDDPDDRLTDYLRSCIASPEPVPGGLRFHTSRHETVPYRCQGLRLDMPDGDPPCIALYCQPRSQSSQRFVLLNRKIDQLNAEILKEQQTAAALRRSQLILEGVVNNATALIYIKSPEGSYLLINRHFEELFGLHNSEVQGKTDFDLFPTDIAQILRDNDETVVRTRQALQVEEEVPHADKSHTYLSVKFPLLEADGSVYAVGGISTDITAIKAAREQLSRFNEELEARVALRTRDLQVSNRELEAYSYTIAHDLRAPLRAIVGFSQILKEEAGAKLDAGENDSLTRIANAGKHMAELIDDILELGRVARAQIAPVDVDLSRLAGEVTKRLDSHGRPLATVTVHIQPGLCVRGDIGLLDLLLQNLLENAFKYSARTAAPHVEFGITKQAGETAYFVRDNGVGFDMNHADKLFQPFARLHGRDEYPGTGVGLATVQSIVQRHGGRVWAEAVPGKGATFYFTLGILAGESGNTTPLVSPHRVADPAAVDTVRKA